MLHIGSDPMRLHSEEDGFLLKKSDSWWPEISNFEKRNRTGASARHCTRGRIDERRKSIDQLDDFILRLQL
jgi:hypothetical protein